MRLSHAESTLRPLRVRRLRHFETSRLRRPPYSSAPTSRHHPHSSSHKLSVEVIHSPTATVASSASSQEKALRESLETHRDVAAAANIGKILGERLLLKNIPAVSVQVKREQKYHGKVKAVIDNAVGAGVKLL